jgi:hypothetical protein
MNITAFYSNYDYFLGFRDEVQNTRFDWNSNIINYSLKPDFTYFINTRNTLRFGIQSIVYDFRPGNAIATSEQGANGVNLPPKYALESSIYADNEQKVGEKLTLQYGLRFSTFQYLGTGTAYFYDRPADGSQREPSRIQSYGRGEVISSYGNLEPRFSANYSINDNSSLKLSYNRTAQYIHLVSNTAASTPLDVWTPSTNNIKPQTANQVALGYFRNFDDNTYEFSVEGYYKSLDNQLDFVDNANLLLNPNLEGDLIQGIGRAYGLEFFLRKTKGRFTGFMSYTLSRTERQLPNTSISRGEWFLARFDRPHNLNLTADFMISELWSVAGNFVLQSPTPATLYTNRAELRDLPVVPLLPEERRNTFRDPRYAYHRLDFSVTKRNRKKEGRRWESYWVFSVYNAYNRRNPFSIYFQQNPNYYGPVADGPSAANTPATQAIRFSVVGSVVPAVSYNFKF